VSSSLSSARSITAWHLEVLGTDALLHFTLAGTVRSVKAAFFPLSLFLCVSHFCRQYFGLLGIDVCGGITLAEYCVLLALFCLPPTH
jgi:hypothetical protein